MTYTQIKNDLSYEGQLALRNIEPALRVIHFFAGRKGFKYWWHDIDAETKDEIYEELKEVLK